MNDVISVAADALLPILAAGGGAVASGAANEAGTELYKAATSVIAKIVNLVRGIGKPDLSKTEVMSAIRAALDDGSLTMTEIDRLCSAYRTSPDYYVGSVKADNVFIGNSIHELNIGRRDK
jgi:hypothetical protein